MTNPLVSVLIPAFNAEHTIGDTLRSAFAQTWPNIEVIVVNDGSRDRTADIVGAAGDRRVRMIEQVNQGAAAARNTAYSACRGDLIQWLDADDLLAPDKIARQVEMWRQLGDRRLLLSGAWAGFMHRPDRAAFRPTPLWNDLTATDWLLRKMRDNLYMQTATWLVARELTEAAGAWDTHLLADDDGEYFCRVLMASHGVKFVPQARVYYRSSGVASLSYIGQSSRKLEAHLLSIRKHVRYLRSLEDSARIREACGRYLQTELLHFFSERPDLVAEIEGIAAEIGVTLQPPVLPWKYEWVRRLFGWRAARQAQLLLPMVKWSLLRASDKAMLRIQGHPPYARLGS